jgi:hypothetical protein
MRILGTIGAIAAAFLAVATAGSAHAGYTGQTITGTLAFGPNGAFGGQYWSPNTIVAPGTFTYTDYANTDTAAFTDTTLTITDHVNSGANGWKMTFTDAALPFTLLTEVSSNFAPGITFSDVAGIIEVDWLGTGTGGVTYTAVFNVAPVPEPGTLAIFGLGLAGLGLIRRFKAT